MRGLRSRRSQPDALAIAARGCTTAVTVVACLVLGPLFGLFAFIYNDEALSLFVATFAIAASIAALLYQRSSLRRRSDNKDDIRRAFIAADNCACGAVLTAIASAFHGVFVYAAKFLASRNCGADNIAQAKALGSVFGGIIYAIAVTLIGLGVMQGLALLAIAFKFLPHVGRRHLADKYEPKPHE